EDIRELLALPNVHFEISPIAYGALYEYPYTELIPTFRYYYEEFGGSKFLWGSDMPNLERWCTYQQGLDYLRLHWNFISREDKALITGGDAARGLKLGGAPARAARPPPAVHARRPPAWAPPRRARGPRPGPP